MFLTSNFRISVDIGMKISYIFKKIERKNKQFVENLLITLLYGILLYTLVLGRARDDYFS